MTRLACLKARRGHALRTLWWGLGWAEERQGGLLGNYSLQDNRGSARFQLRVKGAAVGKPRQRLEGRPQDFWGLDVGRGRGKTRTTPAIWSERMAGWSRGD